MIIDPKLQNMFENCRARKKALDKKKSIVRALMFVPPALIMLLSVINYAMRLFSGTMIMLMGGVQGGGFSAGPLTFILSVIVTVYAAGETMTENCEAFIRHSKLFYPIAGVLGLASFILFRLEYTVFGLALPILCFTDALLNIAYKRLYDENELLKPLKGYPHFNPMLLSERDLRDFSGSPEEDKPDPESMTPDERLMYEREHHL